MVVTRLLLAAAGAAENAPVEGVTARDTWGLLFIGVLTTVLWLAFRRLKQLSDEPEDKAGGKKP
ncbi:MAG: hypothetical protein AB1730_12060 [Myxococcota bacterium]|jgi:hypothetical protein